MKFPSGLLDGFFLALMEAASFYGGVRHKRYSGQQDLLHKKQLKEPKQVVFG
ncbi:hypothetical protein [Flavobacterium sp. FlaQc-47]|uniref:hypothetical protein n=1 Tax=Flavobacterium sp. FlaQc-47 TaxID=3374180 RepID=UPI003756A182